MHEFNATIRHVQALVLALAMSVTEFLKKYIEKVLPANWEYTQAFTWILVFFGLFVLIEVLQNGLSKGIEKSRWVRRRILGEDYIEGVWKDVLIWNDNGRAVLTAGIVEIGYSHPYVTIAGESYDQTGKRIGNFRSLTASYTSRVLTYNFSKVDNTLDRQVSPGYCEYHFQVFNGKAAAFDGFFFREGSEQKVRVTGERLTKEEVARCDSQEGRSEIVRTYLAHYSKAAQPSTTAP